MSKVAIVGDPSGTGTFTISAPNGNTNRTLVLPDEAGTVLTTAGVPASAMPAGFSDLRCVANTGVGTSMPTLATFYKGIWNSTKINNYNEFDTSNSRFVASESGQYEMTIHTTARLNAAGDVYQNSLYVNGSAVAGGALYEQGMSDANAQGNLIYTAVLTLNANDYVEQYVKWTGGGSGRVANHYTALCFWIVRKVG